MSSTGRRFFLEFPAVPGILGAIALFTATWPWWVLHGTARWAVAPLWTLAEALITALVILNRRDARP